MTKDAFSGMTLEESLHYVREFLLVTSDGNGLESAVTGFGSYLGLPPQIALLPDGRTSELRAPIEYIQQNNKRWPVPIGARLDGASIPRPLWSIIGGPYEGRYRDASIIHDHYCVVRTESWRDTHRMFFEAMRCSGVDSLKAKVMFYAVHRFGPRWGISGLEEFIETPFMSDADAQSFVRDTNAIFKESLDIATVQRLAESYK